MNSKELMDEIYCTAEELETVKSNLNTKMFILHESATFEATKLCSLLAEMATIVENEAYVPINIKYYYECPGYYECLRPARYVFLSYVVKAEVAQKCKTIDDINKLDYDDYFDIATAEFECRYGVGKEEYAKKNEYDVTYQFLLEKLDRNQSSVFKSDILHSDYENKQLYQFEEHEYMKRFIEYLFELKVQNEGKKLSYKRMQKAMYDFLELEKDKPKTKKLVDTNNI